jgi:acetyl-CoA C-acetyltransferase
MTASATGFHNYHGIGALFDDVYLLDGRRTPFGKFCGALSTVSPTDLGIHAARAAIAAAGVDAAAVDQSIVSNIGQASADAFFLPRHIALYAGTREDRPALLVQRICGSGLEVLAQAGEQIALGKAQLVLGVGTDTMSRFPLVSYSARQGFALGRPEFTDLLWAALDDTAAVPMGRTADNLAERYGLTRSEVDAFALASQQRYAAARAAGFYADELAALPAQGSFEVDGLKPRKFRCASKAGLAEDEHPREASLEQLARLPTVFSDNGPTTAGSASGIVDGAAALLIASGEFVRAHGLRPLAKLRGHTSIGVEPAYMGIGPAPAIRGLLAEAKMALSDIGRFEINEAFAAQCLAVACELDLDPARLNVNGGAIAIGHPLGATGVRLALTLQRSLQRDDAGFGIASACIGGGQGIALLLERC